MSKFIVVGYDGDPCPRCKEPTQIREHDVLRDKQLREPFYYSRWFYCTNKHCRTKLIMPPRYMVLPKDREEWA